MEEAATPKVRFVMQQVLNASLLVDNKDEWVHIGRGIIVYIAFLKGATEKEVEKSVSTVLTAQICFHEEWKKNSSVVEIKGDVLVIPQASLVGKLKGKKLQYHGLAEKEEGARLYSLFVKTLQERLLSAVSQQQQQQEGDAAKQPSVKSGTYGNRQGLKFESPGPFTHVFEL